MTQTLNQDTFDYIIVGAGSAGAACAARLSENGKHQVLLLEAGPADTNMWARLPLGVAKVLEQGKIIRHFFTEPDPQLQNRKIYWPRGWVVGGSSTVNGMFWVHGTPHEYDKWAQDGCPGWSYADLLPWFKKIESFDKGDSAVRGKSGPVTITEFKPVDDLPSDFLDAAQAAGVAPRVKDYNARGFGGSFLQFNTRNGVRCNTRMAYLDPAKGRSNLTIMTDAMAKRVLIAGEAGNLSATGVVVDVKGRGEVTLHARREVMLCGGSFNSPQLLELSGVGRRDVLSAQGVPLKHEVNMVGENLSEHVFSPLRFEVKPGVSWNKKFNSVLGQAQLGLRWLTHRDGPLTSTSVTAHTFAPAQSGGEQAQLKLQIQQLTSSNNRGKGALTIDKFDGVAIASFQICPFSRGSAHIQSADPSADPRLISNHLTDPRDLEACLLGLRLSRKIAAAAPMAKWILNELTPGNQSDEALVAYLRQVGATAYHPVGTCRIGVDAAQSVVDPELKVHGIKGLRVADGSVMPTIAATNTNAICIVIGERAAAFALADAQ